MNSDILVVNCGEETRRQLGRSEFLSNLSFCRAGSFEELADRLDRSSAGILMCCLEARSQGRPLDQFMTALSRLKSERPDKDVIAALKRENALLGAETLRRGASDVLILPASTADLDLYLDRAMKRTHLIKHLCFDETCYKNLFTRSQKNYQQLFNEVPCFIYLVDRNFHITDSNKKFNEYFGEHIGEYCFGITKNRDEPCRYCPVVETFRDGRNHSSQAQIISSDGVKHTVLCWTAPIADHRNTITDVMVMMTDITEVRRLEDHLTSLGFMIGSLSHGIKGLLTGLDSGIYQLATGVKKNDMERIVRGYEVTEQMTARIKKLVLDILYYSKTRRLRWQNVPVREFIRDTLAVVKNSARRNTIRIRENIHLNEETDCFDIDQASLQAALVNILENSIEACVDNASRSGHTITVTVLSDTDDIVIQIQDTGHGMDPATLKNCFTIFFSSKGNKGTGLGLYIAHQVITQHRGSITATSELGKGTTFRIALPKVTPDTAKRSVLERPAVNISSGKSVN